jgi:glycogen operon protein
MQKLSEVHRLVLTLHDVQGVAHEEISKIMDCNVGTVRSRLFYARRQLQAPPFEKELLAFVQKVFAISSSNPVFSRRRFFAEDPLSDRAQKDIIWIRPDGGEMQIAEWKDPDNRVLGMLIHGDASDETDERGRPVKGQTLLLFLNGSNRAKACKLPDLKDRGYWHEIVNTAQATHRVPKGTTLNVAPHSLALLCYEGTE